MSEANRSFLRYVVESTPGVTPTNPVFKELLYKSSTLIFKPTNIEDDSITGDRSIAASTQVAYETTGDNTHRLRYGVLDELFQAAFMGSWVAGTEEAATGYTQLAGTFSVATGTNYQVGQLVRSTGFATAADNAVAAVTSTSANTVVVGPLTGGADEASPPAGALLSVVGFQGAAGDFTLTSTGGVNALNSTAGLFTTLGGTQVAPGTWIYIGGYDATHAFATAANKGWYRVLSVATHEVIFDIVPVGFTADAGAGKLIRVFVGDFLRTGTAYQSVTFEREYVGDDNVSRYRYFRGVRLNVNIDVPTKQMIDITMSAMGMTASVISTTRQAGATTLVISSDEDTDVFDGANNVTEVIFNGSQMIDPNIPIALNFAIDNTYRGRNGLANRGFTAIKAGTIKGSGSLEVYLGDASVVNVMQNDSYFPLAMPMLSKDGSQGYLIDIPRAKFTDGGETVTGKDTDIMPKLTYMAHRTTGITPAYTAQMQRFDYLEA